jgi:hypothetical protein
VDTEPVLELDEITTQRRIDVVVADVATGAPLLMSTYTGRAHFAVDQVDRGGPAAYGFLLPDSLLYKVAPVAVTAEATLAFARYPDSAARGVIDPRVTIVPGPDGDRLRLEFTLLGSDMCIVAYRVTALAPR